MKVIKEEILGVKLEYDISYFEKGKKSKDLKAIKENLKIKNGFLSWPNMALRGRSKYLIFWSPKEREPGERERRERERKEEEEEEEEKKSKQSQIKVWNFGFLYGNSP